jgi:predicted amidohydrolase
LGGSVAVRDAADTRPVNRFLLFGPDGPVVHYDKRHLFGFAGEDRYMAAGDAVVTVPVAGVRVSPFVCYDLRFADDFWDVGPTTDLFVVVANWPAERAAHFRALLVARAIENQAYVVGVNRVGDAHGLAHDGGSVVVDPWGAVVVEAGDTDAMIVATIDTDTVARSRADFPTFADRR